MANKFRPQGDMGRYKPLTKWCPKRVSYSWWPIKYHREPVSQWFKIKVWQYLHHLADHAPYKLTKRYRATYNRMMKRDYGSRRHASVRFLNKYTAHRYN